MWVAAAEADGTRRTMIVLISCLLGIAVVLTGLTIWYWVFTRPDDDPDTDHDPDEPILDLDRINTHPHKPLEPSALGGSEVPSNPEELDADGELVTDTSERGSEFSDDGWDAIQQSVFTKFQR